MTPALSIILAVIALLFISLGVFLLSRKIRVPYTVLLVLVGLALIPIAQSPLFSFFNSFQLTPELLFFVFLPILIFESAYNMKMSRMMESIRSISLLAIVSLLVSTFFIAYVLYAISRLLGFPLPLEATFLFGALISATDPVAVLALFKEYGAPKRLSLIFEGESLFNDGTSLALFLIVLEVLEKGWGGFSSILEGVFMFSTMIVGGVLFGGLMGFLFSKMIEAVRDNEHVEITLTMVVAHFTFIFSELISHYFVIGGQHIRFSSIIATVVAAMIIGNYGRHKISPRVEEYMEKFWGYFAFVANSIVFILIGLLFANLHVDLMALVLPLVAVILIVMVGRALSIYPIIGFLNWTKKEDHIPMEWQHLLAWGSLRGALAVTMVLLIPDDLTLANWPYDNMSVKEFIAALTITCIYFTLFIKATTIGPLIKKLKIDAFTPIEETEYAEAKVLVYVKALNEVERFNKKGYITPDMYARLKEKYEALYRNAYTYCKKAMKAEPSIPSLALTIYTTGIEKHSLKTLFYYGEINEGIYSKITSGLNFRQEHAEDMDANVAHYSFDFQENWRDMIRKKISPLFRKLITVPKDEASLYMYYRARAITAQKVIDDLHILAENKIDIFDGTNIFADMIKTYEKTHEWAKRKAEDLRRTYPDVIDPIALQFAEAGLYKTEDRVIKDLHDKEMITPKVRISLEDEFAHSPTLS